MARLIPVLAVVTGLGAVGALATVVQQASPRPAALTSQAVPVSAAIRACPPGVDAGQNRIALFATGAGAEAGARAASGVSLASGGGLSVAALPQAGARPDPTPDAGGTSPGMLALVPVTASGSLPRQQAWSVAAAGPMAPGLTAEVASGSGLSAAPCAQPGSDIWFTGPGQQNGGKTIELYLMNVDSQPAMVNLAITTDAGQVQPSGYTGITVPPHQLVTRSLASVSGGASVVAIEVRTSAGRIAAAVAEGDGHGPPSWLPPAAAPSQTQVIPGVPPSATPPGLLLVVPGTANARVNVIAITAQGKYQPFAGQQVDLPGQSASFVQLSAMGGSAVAIEVSANVPVTATVLVPGSGLGTFTVAAQPVTQQAVIAGNTTGGGLSASVALSAPGATARVRLTESAGAATQTRTVTIPAGRTVSVPVTSPPGTRHGTPFSVVITLLPGSGPVYAARVESQGQGRVVSIVSSGNALTTITLPPARDSYTAIAP